MSNYKRLELYVGWKCNYKCVFCVEKEKIDKYFSKDISESEMLKMLLKYKKLGYNHVTFLGGEPFIQSNFLFSLKIAKKLGYKILVTTNGVLLPYEEKAKIFLPYIDELIISIPIIDKSLQPIINGVKNIIDFEKVFENIKKYWKGNFLKINTVLNKYNYNKLHSISDFLVDYKDIISEISFTYPELNRIAYTDEHLITKVAGKYSYFMFYVEKEVEFLFEKGIISKIVDFPFCVLSSTDFINITDDINYQERTKINNEGIEKSKGEYLYGKPRVRVNIDKCNGCKYLGKCWGPSVEYICFFGDREINPIL